MTHAHTIFICLMSLLAICHNVKGCSSIFSKYLSGVNDVEDNCQFDQNRDQANNDGFTLGDECDSDDDEDSMIS